MPAAKRRWRLRKAPPAPAEAASEAGFALLRLFNAPETAGTAARSLLLTSIESDAADRERVTDLLAEAAVRQGERVLDDVLPHARFDFALNRRVPFEHLVLFGIGMDAHAFVDGANRTELRSVVWFAFRHFDDGAVGQ